MKTKICYSLDYYLIVSISIFLTPVSEQSSLSVSCLNSCESNGAVKENVIDTTQIEPNTTKSNHGNHHLQTFISGLKVHAYTV